ncbi:hypothetical protein AB0D67_11015 [Streptosporangium sp. NPDC048047]|uniref:hypothetical protein n=1 Tax=Streptosporangium sp. NPDC048047 TaxID=3155748 RepID=UPI0034305220
MRTVVSRLVSGRRYRFGRLAALVAGGHAALVVTFGAAAVVNGDARGLRRLMIGWERPDPPPNLGWYVLPLVLAGLAQSWALWRILRGRVIGLPALSEPSGSAGSPEPSGAVAFPGPIRALRAVLYLALAFSLLFLVWPRPPWWVSGLDQAGQLALVILFHRTLTGAFRGLRCTALAAGTLAAISVIGSTVSEEIGLEAAESVFSIAVLDGLPWLLWMSLVLVAQSQDGRWRRGTVWAGISYLVLVFIVSPLMFDLAFLGGFEDTVYGAVQAFSGNTMLVGAVEALSVTLPV